MPGETHKTFQEHTALKSGRNPMITGSSFMSVCKHVTYVDSSENAELDV